MPSYKLTYFDGRGRGELARCVFGLAGVPFEDVRLTSAEWQAQKADSAYGQLPELSVDGKVLCQSSAIARFLAKEFNLAGANNWEAAMIDQYVEMTGDLFGQCIKAFSEKDENKRKELLKKINEEVVPKFMGFFQNDLEANGGQVMVGKSLTLADLAVQNVFDSLLMKEPSAMDKFPTLKAHRQRLLTAPNIGNYLKNRKKTDI